MYFNFLVLCIIGVIMLKSLMSVLRIPFHLAIPSYHYLLEYKETQTFYKKYTLTLHLLHLVDDYDNDDDGVSMLVVGCACICMQQGSLCMSIILARNNSKIFLYLYCTIF